MKKVAFGICLYKLVAIVGIIESQKLTE